MAGRGWPLLPLPPVKALSVALSEASGGAQGYRGGQEVSGQVSLEVAAPLRLRALRLEACGGARAAWTEAPPMQQPPPPPPPPATGTRLEAEVPYLEARRELLLAGEPREGGREAERASEDYRPHHPRPRRVALALHQGASRQKFHLPPPQVRQAGLHSPSSAAAQPAQDYTPYRPPHFLSLAGGSNSSP